jgi:hypothetical protein
MRCIVAFAFPAVLAAQNASGIDGTIADTNGAAIPGVRVAVSSPTLTRETTTDSGGLYSVDVPTGTYSVSVQGVSRGSLTFNDDPGNPSPVNERGFTICQRFSELIRVSEAFARVGSGILVLERGTQ